MAQNTALLRPQDVTGVHIPWAGWGKRGYDKETVDIHLEQVSAGVAALHTDRTELQRSLNATRIGAMPLTPASDDQQEEGHIQAVHVLSRAQRTADQYVASAQEYSRNLAEDAQRRRAELLTEARVKASLIIQEAQARGERAANRVPDGLPPLTSGQRRDLEAEIAFLRAFYSVCRTHFRARAVELVEAVDAWEKSDSPEAAAARSQLPALSLSRRRAGPDPASPAALEHKGVPHR